MAMVVNNNIPALMTYNTVNRTSSALEKSIQKLSTGLRINSAADDAAGLAISEKMRAQISGLDRAVSNAQDGISMIQTAEGALSETHSILQRMRELSVQAANDTLTQQDRGYIQLEIDQLREEITRIGNTTQFNKKKLLNGDAAVLWSSDDLNTKAIVKGGLRSIDQFGQKVVKEGNYKISIRAEAGQAEVQKSDIFKIKHPNVLMNVSTNPAAGVKSVAADNLPAGSYTISGKSYVAPTSSNGGITATGQYGIFGVSESYYTRTDSSGTTKLTGGASNGDVFAIKDGSGNVLASVKVTGTDTNGYFLEDGTEVKTEGDVWNALLEQLRSDEAQSIAGQNGYKIQIRPSDSNGKTDIRIFRADGKKLSTDSSGNGLTLEKTGSGGVTIMTGLDSSGRSNYVSDSNGFTNDLAKAIGFAGSNGSSDPDLSKITGSSSIAFEVTGVNSLAGTITLKAMAMTLNADGTTSTRTASDIVLKQGDSNGIVDLVDAGLLAGDSGALAIKLLDRSADKFTVGDKFVYNVVGSQNASPDVLVEVSGQQDNDWGENWTNLNPNVTDNPVKYALDSKKVAGKDVALKNYYLNEKTGEISEGTITLTTDDKFTADNVKDQTLATFDATFIGKVAGGDVKLRDLDKFWNTEGVFMLDDPKTITITQGDGKQTSITLSANDTLNDVARKLNEAIGTGLGQAQYVDDASHFATYVETPGANSESVKGTFLIRSVVPGSSGKLSLSGDEGIINAFSLNVIQDAKESTYTVGVKDAHTGEVIADNVKISGNRLIGIIDPNVDVEFDAMGGVSAKWDGDRKAYSYNEGKAYTTVLHLSDNTTVFQIGANEGEDMGIHIGDMRAAALGLNSVLVTDRASAARSITIIDNAIDKVSSQRAMLGAYQNRLEHTINNLITASENLTAAESRIRDTDMAKEMMNFTKLQIMLQAGTSMLAQANQLPQNVLGLIR